MKITLILFFLLQLISIVIGHTVAPFKPALRDLSIPYCKQTGPITEPCLLVCQHTIEDLEKHSEKDFFDAKKVLEDADSILRAFKTIYEKSNKQYLIVEGKFKNNNFSATGKNIEYALTTMSHIRTACAINSGSMKKVVECLAVQNWLIEMKDEKVIENFNEKEEEFEEAIKQCENLQEKAKMFVSSTNVKHKNYRRDKIDKILEKSKSALKTAEEKVNELQVEENLAKDNEKKATSENSLAVDKKKIKKLADEQQFMSKDLDTKSNVVSKHEKDTCKEAEKKREEPKSVKNQNKTGKDDSEALEYFGKEVEDLELTLKADKEGIEKITNSAKKMDTLEHDLRDLNKKANDTQKELKAYKLSTLSNLLSKLVNYKTYEKEDSADLSGAKHVESDSKKHDQPKNPLLSNSSQVIEALETPIYSRLLPKSSNKIKEEKKNESTKSFDSQQPDQPEKQLLHNASPEIKQANPSFLNRSWQYLKNRFY